MKWCTVMLCCLLAGAASSLPYTYNSLNGFTPGPNVREEFGVENSDFHPIVPQDPAVNEVEAALQDSNTRDEVIHNDLQPAFSKLIEGEGKAPAFGALVHNSEVNAEVSSNAGKQADPSFGGYDQQDFGSPFGGSQQSFDTSVSENQPQGFDASFSGNQQQSFDASITGDQPQVYDASLGDQQQPSSGFDASFNVGQQPDYFDGQQQQDVVYNVDNVQGSMDDSAINFGVRASSLGAPLEVPGPYNVVIEDDFYLRTAIPSAGYRPTRYTSLDLAQVDFQGTRSNHKEYITVRDDSGEREVYRLVGVAPSSAVSGGAARTYSASIGNTVPVYQELDDDDHDGVFRLLASRPNFYSAHGGAAQPLMVRAEATISGNNFAVLLDD